MQLFVTLGNKWKLLIVVTMDFFLAAYGLLDLFPVISV